MAQHRPNNGDHGTLSDLQADLGYEFDDPALLRRALTHRSFANEHDEVTDDNQRLEFLGDAVLGVVVAEALFRRHPQAPEGKLSRRLAELVCEPSLVDRARGLRLGEYLRLGRGEEMTGGRAKEALLADAYEAVLGAVFLDSGHGRVRDLILEHFAEVLGESATTEGDEAGAPRDYKSLLQREVQSRRPIRPGYEIVETNGPPHDREFVAEVLVETTVVGRGNGSSKQEAEQAAAAEAVADLEARRGPIAALFGEDVDDETLQRTENLK